MNVPKPENLISQSFNSERFEFAWQFGRPDKFKDQFILQINRNPVIYMEWGIVNDSGCYTETEDFISFGYGHLDPEAFLIHEANWAPKKFPPVYGNFSGGRDFVCLIEDVTKYLNSI